MKAVVKPSWKYPGKWIALGCDGRPLGLYKNRKTAERKLKKRLSAFVPTPEQAVGLNRKAAAGINFKSKHRRARRHGQKMLVRIQLVALAGFSPAKKSRTVPRRLIDRPSGVGQS